MHLPPEIWEIIESYIPIAEFYRHEPKDTTIKQALEERGPSCKVRRFLLLNGIHVNITVLANEYISKIDVMQNDQLLFTLGNEGFEFCTYFICEEQGGIGGTYNIMGIRPPIFCYKMSESFKSLYKLHDILFPRQNTREYEGLHNISKFIDNPLFTQAYKDIEDTILYPKGLRKLYPIKGPRFTASFKINDAVCNIIYYLAMKERIWCTASYYMLYYDNAKIPKTLPKYCVEL